MVTLEAADKYVAYVREKVRSDPGRRSALRRSLGRPVEDVASRRAHSVVAPWLPADRTRPAVESAFYSVAALIAAQPRDRNDQTDTTADTDKQETATQVPLDQDKPVGDDKPTASKKAVRASVTLGGTVGQAVRDKKLNADSVEARLHLLCRQDVAGLHRMLPGLIRQLAAKEIAPDWGRLLVDLSRWERDRGRVTKQWLQDFYRTIHKADQVEPNDDNDSESEDR